MIDSNPSNIDAFFGYCNAVGLKVIRTWAFNHQLPQAWGSYDENQFKTLDYIVKSAGSHNVKLIFALGELPQQSEHRQTRQAFE